MYEISFLFGYDMYRIEIGSEYMQKQAVQKQKSTHSRAKKDSMRIHVTDELVQSLRKKGMITREDLRVELKEFAKEFVTKNDFNAKMDMLEVRMTSNLEVKMEQHAKETSENIANLSWRMFSLFISLGLAQIGAIFGFLKYFLH